MGPVFDPALVSAGELAAALLPFLKTRYGVQHIEMTCCHDDELSGFAFSSKRLTTYRVPLFPGEEERVLQNFKAKTRNQLRKARKLGLVAQVEEEESFVAEFYDQVKEVFRRRGKSVPFGQGRVLECFRHLKNSGNLLAISVNLPQINKRIATGLFMHDGTELHLWGWAHRTAFRWYCPMELLTWTAMLKGMELGCTTLDMAGGGEAKLKFGAVPDTTLYQLTWSRYSWLARTRNLAEKTYRSQQSFRGRLNRIYSSGDRTLKTPQIAEEQSQAQDRIRQTPMCSVSK
jgi:hypothetical protein